MQFGKAISAGVVGAGLMTIVMAIARFAGMSFDFEMILGSMFTGFFGPGVWLIGLLIHLIVGALFACIYAFLFERVVRRAGAAVGIALGLGHAIISGFAIGLILYIHPLVPEALMPPGMFMSNLGPVGVLAFFMLHLMYGATVGAYYKPILLKNQRLIPTA